MVAKACLYGLMALVLLVGCEAGLPGGLEKADVLQPAAVAPASTAPETLDASQDAPVEALAKVADPPQPLDPPIEDVQPPTQTVEQEATALAIAEEQRAQQQKEHQQKTEQLQQHLEDMKAAHAEQVQKDAAALAAVKATTTKALSLQSVLAKAKHLLIASQEHIKKLEQEIPVAEAATEATRATAAQANTDLEQELNAHHLSLGAVTAGRGEDSTQGQTQMLETIREKRQHAHEGLMEVEAQRIQLSQRVQAAVTLLDRLMSEQEAKPSKLTLLKVDAAKAHVAQARQHQGETAEVLDGIQAQYQTAHDQLRDTELTTLLFDAKVSGSLSPHAMQELVHKMRVAENADAAFAHAVHYAHQLHEETPKAQAQLKASYPVLRHTVRLLERLKAKEQVYHEAEPAPTPQ